MKTLYNKKTDSLPVINGDLFKNVNNYLLNNNTTSIIVPHVCNNINLFGAGFAAAVAHHYPIVKENYHLLGNHFLKNNLGYTQFIKVAQNNNGHRLIFANMIAQNGTISKNNPRPLNYVALMKSMSRITTYINENFYGEDQKIQIHCPKFGCGLAGGNWNFIEELIKDIWSNQIVFIYNYNQINSRNK